MKTTLELLTDFVNQKPSLDFADYGDSKSYNAESREITKDRTDFLELMNLYLMRVGDKANEKLTYNLVNTSGRLSLKKNCKGVYLDYVTGQYFPTEYRPAACRIIAQLIWNDYVNEPEANSPNPIYKDGHEIRKAISRSVSRRVMKNYFN